MNQLLESYLILLPENHEGTTCPSSGDSQHGGEEVVLRILFEGDEESTDGLVCPVCVYEEGGGPRIVDTAP